uniref:Reverse transcriptase domain-containing protein n=1 Tax=Tanacetum cinerariifolium TaxID=118510 RepID=A0A6L2MMS0_TANCI|nr:reverse transcriptase domain-containing protein [Tanacetum cinerariifolium]
MIPEPGDANCEIIVTETFHLQTNDELSDKELKQIKVDDQAIQTILLGLLEDIYAAVDSCETAQEIWLRKEVDELKVERLAKTQDPLALMANSNNPYAFLVPHQDQSSLNQNYLQQPMTNPEDIIDPTTAMNMALALMAKAFKLNYSTPTNNNQRISSNPKNRQIAQPGNLAGYNDVIRNQIRNGNLVAARTEGNAAGQNRNQIRCYNCRGVDHYARNCTTNGVIGLRTFGENDLTFKVILAFQTAYKTPIGCTPYKLVYGKACHLPIELEYKAYWTLKHANFDLQTAGGHRKIQLNELNELRDQAYENSSIYKEKTKRLHDSKIKDRVFNIGDRVLLFNYRLNIFSGKLKTRSSGLFIISHVFSYGTVKLSQIDGPNFKVNGHKLKHYFGEDIPKTVVPDLQTFIRTNEFRDWVKLSDPKQALRGRHPMLILVLVMNKMCCCVKTCFSFSCVFCGFVCPGIPKI